MSTLEPSVLIAAESWFGSTAFGIARGFRRLGWQVQEIDTARWFPSGGSRLRRAARRAVRWLGARRYNDAMREGVARLRPTALLAVKGIYIAPETLRYARSLGVRTVNYYPDFHFDYAGLDPDTFACYDHFFTTKPFQVDSLASRLGRGRVSYLPHGYSTDVHRAPDSPAAYECDVVYVGVHTAHKERWLSELARRVAEVSLKIYGNGWERLPRSSALRARVAGAGVVGADYCRALQTARICLAIHSGPREPGGWEDQVSTRTFEIPACRGFMLHVDTPEVRGFFEPETEIGVFSCADSLCSQVERYLRCDRERERMIERAWRRCVPAYSYDARAATIAAWLESGAAS
jgi:hypothetical protein